MQIEQFTFRDRTIVAVLLVAWTVVACAPARQPPSDRQRQEAIDLEMVKRTFFVEYSPDRGLWLNQRSPSRVDFGELDAQALEYSSRWNFLSDAHYILARHDPKYRRGLRRAEKEILAAVDMDMSRAEGSELVVRAFRANGILEDLLGVMYPLSSRIDRPIATALPWDRDQRFVTGPMEIEDHPPSVRIFSYCANGMTTSTDPTSPYVRAHRMLRANDREYASAFEEVVRAISRSADDAVKDDVLARARMTDRIRDEVVQRGLDRKLDAVVARQPEP